MRLHTIDVGTGARTAVLLHGMMGSAESWLRVTDRLVEDGYRVLALDLPGHGLSPRDRQSTVHRAADAVVDTVQALLPSPPAVAIGHSYGGSILGLAATRLRPSTTVFVDAGTTVPGGYDLAELTAQYEADRQRRTLPWLNENRAYAGDAANEAEARAAENFDPATAASISSGGDVHWLPAPGSIIVRAAPSQWVSDDDARHAASRGVLVRDIPGAAHTVWYSHFDEFVAALPEVFD